jgi:hypothetical protein
MFLKSWLFSLDPEGLSDSIVVFHGDLKRDILHFFNWKMGLVFGQTKPGAKIGRSVPGICICNAAHDKDPDSTFYLNSDHDPDPGSHADQDPGQTLLSKKLNFYMEKTLKIGNMSQDILPVPM